MFEVAVSDLGESEFFNELGLSKFLFEEVYSTLIDKEKPKLKIIF